MWLLKDILWQQLLLLLLLMASSSSSLTSSQTQVPLNTTSNAANNVPKDDPSVSMPLQQQQSVFYVNHNQQNVIQLRHQMESKLRTIRNVEMRVSKIQEIFDSIHFSSVNGGGGAPTAQQFSSQDLQLFSQRLGDKLQKASHLVMDLRDIFRFNLTKVLQYSYVDQDDDDDDDEGEEVESEFDFEMEDIQMPSPATEQLQHLYLNTHIENCQPDYAEDGSSSPASSSSASSAPHYNKQQIEILNYQKGNNDHASFLNENNGRSLVVNDYITEQLTQVRRRLVDNDETNESSNKPSSGHHFKHIYFLSNSDGAAGGLHFRHLYVSAIKQKFVLLLLDVGSALNRELFDLTKGLLQEILQLLDDSDKISLITISNEADFMYLDAFPAEAAHGIYRTTRGHKEEVLNYINNLNVARSGLLTNHTLGFEYAFEMLQRLEKSKMINTAEQPVEFIYITRGLLTNLSDALAVLRVLAAGQAMLQAPIIINTCAVVLDEKRIMYEKQFLSDVASQNYTKYDINVSQWWPNGGQELAGRFFVLSKLQEESMIPQISSKIFAQVFRERFLTNSLEVHPPTVDSDSGDVLVSLTYSVAPYGVVGVNLYLADLLEDILNYASVVAPASSRLVSSYGFLLERSTGNTLAHPAFPRPLIQRETSYPVNIAYLENATDFASVIRQRLLHEDAGNATTHVYVGKQLIQRTYHWQSVRGIYVLCLVSNGNDPLRNTSSNHRFNLKDGVNNYEQAYYGDGMDLLYHRLDLMQNSAGTCRYFRQMATMDAPTLFLSAAAFKSPFGFLQNNRPRTQLPKVDTILAYLKVGLIANPGLRPRIRHEVSVLYQAMLQLRRRHQDARGSLRGHIIRRYIASVSGVLQLYPGCLLSSTYDPTRRPWFRQAMAQPGKIVSTAPYLDAGGAGYIITLAHTIFEGKSHALHSAQQDRPVAVVALDVPYAFYYRLILDSTPLCQLPHMKCLIFEHEGYLMAHPSMLQPATPLKNQRRPHEHLTHKESYLANDVLNHVQLVRKLGCASYQNRTLQRYYAFNTSMSTIMTNLLHGERTKYALALIRGSNLFAAVLNSSCDVGPFCPCSTIDRVCLNCKRMDQTDCECPCECPMDSDSPDSYANYTQQFAYCSPRGEHFIALPPTQQLISSLPSCPSPFGGGGGCDSFATQRECLGIMGCEWCQQDVDGNTFTSAFCSPQASCFNGVLASLTPYGELDEMELLAAHNPQREQHAYSAFGPLGGAIIVLVMVIGFAIYCYRHNLDNQTQEHFYVDSVQEENYGLPLSRFNFDDCQGHDDPPLASGGYDHAAGQRQLMHAADISPYHVSSGSSYRRPPNGESDHGYSTMTPHEDSSDQQCFTLAEPLLMHDKRHSKSDTMSISTSISSPTNRQQSSTQPNIHPYLSNQPTTKTERYKHHQATGTPSPCRGQTILPSLTAVDVGEEGGNSSSTRPQYILAPVTVHRHMETAES
ncbi:VWFA and cache domain-containing protein CG16868 [Drosophila tropicalis]|uniref:VWFA and cache domain-containing protein CG16868 n=1 Tax=Drosophila tropicalis TaxID=46794 RepID=UPI0035ABBF2D